MQRSLDLQIRDHIADYVTGRTSFRQFMDRFMDAADEAEESNSASLLDFVDTVKLYWSEYTGGDHTEDEFRALLRPFVESYVLAFAPDHDAVGSSPAMRPGSETTWTSLPGLTDAGAEKARLSGGIAGSLTASAPPVGR